MVSGTTQGNVDQSGNVTPGVLNNPQVYAIDDAANSFSQSIYGLNPPVQEGAQVLNAGVFSVAQRGLRSLGITASYASDTILSPAAYVPQAYNPPESGSFAVELANQAGGLVQLVGQPVAPLVAARQCPNLSSAQTYQFVTIPGGLVTPSAGPQTDGWDPTTDTAYGSVSISSSGANIKLDNIQQFTLPSAGGSGAPAQPATSSVSGVCGSTYFGNLTEVPGQLTITNPGGGSGTSQQSQFQAKIGIGPSGLLVEDNGTGQVAGSQTLPYNNVLGAGTGAIGLPSPGSALSTSSVVGAQYLGFIYNAGVYTTSGVTGWASHLASFGFSNVPTSCATVASSTATLIYGGNFTNDDPSTSPDGFGSCDFAIDLGTQNASNNGLYSQATVWVGAGYPSNSSGAAYSFPAVAIAGQLNGKFAIFLIGTDSTQPWAAYLLQTN